MIKDQEAAGQERSKIYSDQDIPDKRTEKEDIKNSYTPLPPNLIEGIKGSSDSQVPKEPSLSEVILEKDE